jgi:RNA polymerase sigma-70 factor (ECF subfamily)
MTNSSGKFNDNVFDPFYEKDYNNHFEELYVPLCQYAQKFVNDHDVAEDIVQDNFVYLWENWTRLSKIDSIKAYMFVAVKNKSINYLQKKYIKNTLRQIEDFQDSMIDYQHPTALELLECQELEVILERALNQLPERCRIIFTMKRFAGKSNKEIAKDLDISIKTVEAQMTIAIRKLNVYVNTHWELPSIILLNIILGFPKKIIKSI